MDRRLLRGLGCGLLAWGLVGCQVIQIKKKGDRSHIQIYRGSSQLQVPSFSAPKLDALVRPFAGRTYGAGDLIPMATSAHVRATVLRRDVGRIKRACRHSSLFRTPVIQSAWVHSTLQIGRDWSAVILGAYKRAYRIKKIWLQFLFQVDNCNLVVAGHSQEDRCPRCGIHRQTQRFLVPGSKRIKRVYWVDTSQPRYLEHLQHTIPFRNCPTDWRRKGSRALLRLQRPTPSFEQGCKQKKGGKR